MGAEELRIGFDINSPAAPNAAVTINWPDAISAVAGVATAGAALWAAFLAKNGLRTWKEQLSGQSRYDAARRTVLAALRLKAEVQAFRSPLMMAGELAQAAKSEGVQLEDGEDLTSPKVAQAATATRWRAVQQAVIELDAAVLEAEVVIDDTIRTLYEEINSDVKRLWTATHLCDLSLRERREALARGVDTPEQSQLDRKNRRIRTLPIGDVDEFGDEVARHAEAIKAHLKPHLLIGS